MVANISHDLRAPLTSLHGYLETLRLKDATLEADERRRYLDIALAQSRKVGRLAQGCSSWRGWSPGWCGWSLKCSRCPS